MGDSMEEGTTEKEEFRQFLGNYISLIVEDKGYDYPRKKTGQLISANNTHLILKTDDGKMIAILRSTILRIEKR